MSELPKLVGLRTYVGDLMRTKAFWRQHFGLSPRRQSDVLRYALDEIVWEHVPGGRFCGTRGPHGILPVFRIDDFSHARGYLLAHDIPIVFEELIPGLNLLIFLDPDSNPFELAEEVDPGEWDISQRKALRTKRRQDAPQETPISLRGISELTIYTHDITASVHFYRDVIGLPVGLSYFAHVHLVADNVPVVLRTTRWQCKAPHQPHGAEAVFTVADLDALAERLRQHGYDIAQTGADELRVRDPIGIPLRFWGVSSAT